MWGTLLLSFFCLMLAACSGASRMQGPVRSLPNPQAQIDVTQLAPGAPPPVSPTDEPRILSAGISYKPRNGMLKVTNSQGRLVFEDGGIEHFEYSRAFLRVLRADGFGTVTDAEGIILYEGFGIAQVIVSDELLAVRMRDASAEFRRPDQRPFRVCEGVVTDIQVSSRLMGCLTRSKLLSISTLKGKPLQDFEGVDQFKIEDDYLTYSRGGRTLSLILGVFEDGA